MRRLDFTSTYGLFVVVALASTAACASAPPSQVVPVTPPAPVVTIDQKAAWILRLEHERLLAGPEAGADLLRLVTDPDAAIRRRSALALGRAGWAEALPALVSALADAEASVRATAAFALGLLADARAEAPLTSALGDASPLVRGRAAEALGLMGATTSAAAIAAASAACPALVAPMAPDDESLSWAPEVEACRLAMLSLVRLRDYPALARVVLSESGQPVSTWWPVAFALQRSADPRSAAALASLVDAAGVYSQAFALRGLAALRDPRVAPPALAVLARADADVRLRAQAIRALGEVAERRAIDPLVTLIDDRATPRGLRLEALQALAAIGAAGGVRAIDAVLDLRGSPRAEERAAALAAAARIDGAALISVLSTSERDRDWLVRARLAEALGGLSPELSQAALEDLAEDADSRVQTAALRSLARQGAADVDRRALAALGAPDVALRAAAAAVLGERRPAAAAAALASAYTRALTDATPTVRLAVLAALQQYPDPAPDAMSTLLAALADPEWAVRLRAAAALRQRGQAAATPSRPAPSRYEAAFFESDAVLRPRYSPQAYIETTAGLIQLELDVVNAPLTTQSFMALARAGFYNGIRIHRVIPNFVVQAGDPRGDGEGGPGFTIRDELSPQPFVRGTVGMALAGPETGGSQFFVTLSPQPHLDGRYTVFGRVVAGLERLDHLSVGDAIVSVTIVDGSAR